MSAVEVCNVDFLKRVTTGLVSLGKIDGAFGWLEKSFAARDRREINFNQDPQWDPIRNDPRFNALLSKINLRATS